MDTNRDEYGAELNSEFMPNGEVRFRTISEDGAKYIRTVAGESGGWQNSHFHRECREYYVIQTGWMAYAHLMPNGEVAITICEPSDFVYVEPMCHHNVYLPENAVIHTIKIGGQPTDWVSSPELDKQTKTLSESAILEGSDHQSKLLAVQTDASQSLSVVDDLQSVASLLNGRDDSDAIRILDHVTAELKARTWSPAKQATNGLIVGFQKALYERWHHEMFVNEDGGVSHIMDGRMRNVSTEPIEKLYFVIYSDAADVDVSCISPWVQISRQSMPATLCDWDPDNSAGSIEFDLLEPIEPGNVLRYKMGYFMPDTFDIGDEYYNFDWGAFHLHASCHIHFSQSTIIEHAEWKDGGNRFMPPPKVSSREIILEGHYPQEGSRCTLVFKTRNANDGE